MSIMYYGLPSLQTKKSSSTFGTKFIPSSTVAVAIQIIPEIAYLMVGLSLNRATTGATAMPAVTMVYTEKMTTLESLSSFTLIFLVSKAKMRLKTSSIALYTMRIGPQIWLLSEEHKYTSVGSSPFYVQLCITRISRWILHNIIQCMVSHSKLFLSVVQSV